MNAMEHLLQQHPPVCVAKTATRTSRADIPASVTYTMLGWINTPPVIDLEHDDDTVYWNLSFVYLFPWGGPIERVYIKFDSGPLGFDPNTGPHCTISLDDTIPGQERLIGDKRKNSTADFGCYTYNLWVKLKDDQTPKNVFPIDPQIDNLPPPIHMLC